MELQPENPGLDEAAVLVKKIHSAAGWMFVIAGLSIVNTVLTLAGSDRTFLFGLTITTLIDGIASAIVAEETGGVVTFVRVVEFGLDFIVLAIAVGLGVLVRQARTWALVLALVFYGLDTLLAVGFALLSGELWLSAIVHVVVVWMIAAGLIACRKLNVLLTEQAMAAAAVAPAAAPVAPVEA